MEFEWDPKKALINLKKHGVSFTEAAEAFLDENAIEIYDDANSNAEIRYQLVAISRSRLLFVIHTERDDVIRIISARKANEKQIRIYNEQNR
jgi:uncharacterized DUF497 family protein